MPYYLDLGKELLNYSFNYFLRIYNAFLLLIGVLLTEFTGLSKDLSIVSKSLSI